MSVSKEVERGTHSYGLELLVELVSELTIEGPAVHHEGTHAAHIADEPGRFGQLIGGRF